MSGSPFSLRPVPVKPIKTRHRRIGTSLPVPASIPFLKSLNRTESQSMHGQLPVIWDHARGASVWDRWGNRWIDFTSTIFVANAGHAHPHIVRSLRDQLQRGMLHSYTFATEARVRFLESLVRTAGRPFEKAFLVSSGTEATEAALKLMRLHGLSKNSKKVNIISFRGSMHGRTMGAELLKGNQEGSAWIAHRDPHLHYLEFPFPWITSRTPSSNWQRIFSRQMASLLRQRRISPGSICGFMLESYIGWGALFFPSEYVRALVRFARSHGALVTFDEIQGGFGRTGKMFTYQHYRVRPDLICVGKGMSSSLPLAGVLGPSRIMDLPPIGSMSSTHSASPLPCAAGRANLEVLRRERLVEKAARDGRYLHERLNKIQARFPHRVHHVFGKGLLAAVLFKDPFSEKPDGPFATRVCLRAMQKGLLLVHTGRESIKFGPPLVISRDALSEGLDVFEEALAEVIQEAK